MKTSLNLGCGKNYMADCINADINLKVNADVYFDMETDKWPFPNNTFKKVYCKNVLEHLGDGYLYAMQELYRVCKNKAIIYITTPHHLHNCFFDDPNHKRPITHGGLVLFDQKINKEYIENGYSNSTLGLDLEIDFTEKKHYYVPEDSYVNKDYKSLQKYAFHHANIFKEFYIELIVRKA